MATEMTPEQSKLILDISRDFYRYAEHNLWIKNKGGRIIRFVPNKAQRALIDRVIELLAQGKPIRIIILKARQMGLSTAVEAIIYWWTTTHKNITAMIVGHEDASSSNLYWMFKRYYDNSHPFFKPTRKYNTRNDLVFDKEDGTGLGSIIKTATAKNVSAGRSDTVQLVHGSEVGEWSNGEELVAGLLQTVPVLPGTMVFLESTANGMGNYFHKEWESAKKGDSNFEPFFFPWWMHDEYEMEGELNNVSEEEQQILEIFRDNGVPEEKWAKKMLFRRYKEREFRSDPQKLYQEYPSTDLEAFLASGRPRFHIPALVKLLHDAENTPFETYELTEATDRTITPEIVPDAPLKIWKMPERGREYVIGADTAEGLKGGDWSVADVIDKQTLETVARYRGHPDPDIFGHILDKLGRFYNYALVGVEINNHGLTVVQRLRDLFYTNLYRREKGLDERFEESTSHLGWRTDIRTKKLMIDYLAEAIRDGLIIEHDVVFCREAMTYVVDDSGRTNAEEGTFDDTVMAKAVALQMFEWSNTNKADLYVYKPEKQVSRKSQHKVIK